MRLRCVLALALVTACGSRLRREVVGHGAATVQPRGHEVVAASGGIQLARGRYELALRFDVPRAQVIDYTVTCGDVTMPGRVGETFEAYRTRRLAELRRMAERDRRNMAAVTGAVVGAVAPTVHASGQAVGPGGAATVDATMSGQAVGAAAGEAVADAAVPAVIELPPGDVGAGRLKTRVALTTATDGTCTVSALAEDAHVVATYEVTRIRDLDAEARERRVAATANARQVRGSLTAQLELHGADPHALQRRREAQARARLEAEAARARARAEADAARAQARAEAEAQRAQARAEAEAQRAQARREAQAERDRARARADAARAEAQARAEAERARERAAAQARLDAKLAIEVRRRDAALHARGMLIAYLAGECHADPHKRERERAAEAAARAEAELALRLELEVRRTREARLEAERQARLAIELEARRAREAKLEAERQARLAIELEARRAREAKLEAEREARVAAERAREAERSRRLELALGVRAELQTYLVGLGAKQRPPMPALLAETPGEPPFDGAAWIAGYWQWTGAQWAWVAGGWRDTTRFGASGSVGGRAISIGAGAASVVIEPPIYTDPTIRVQPDVPVQTPAVRDHRTVTPEPTVRDHRTGAQEPTVRDHRTGSEPTVRDHREQNDTSEGKRSNVRDHRRR